MCWRLPCVLGALIAADPSGGAELPAPPKGPPPEVVHARAFTRDGKVRLECVVPLASPTPETRVVERGGRRVQVTVMTTVSGRRTRR